MDLRDRPEDEAFRKEVRAWLSDHVVGEFAALGGRGGSGDETYGFETRLEWEKVLAAGGWTGLGWPVEYGGRGASIAHQVIFNEEYVRAKAPGRVSVLGEGLLGPTLIQYGTPEQQARFLPPILAGTELWCQGYSEPDAGSDLANVQTKAQLDGDEWVVTGQKVWTSLAHQADWCFVVCRTEPGLGPAPRALLPPGAHGPARRGDPSHHPAHPDLRVQRGLLRRGPDRRRPRGGRGGRGVEGGPGHPGLRAGVGLLGHQLSFRRELDRLLDVARANGRPPTRSSASGWPAPMPSSRSSASTPCAACRATTDRWHRPRPRSSSCTGPRWHRRLGELAIDVRGPAGLVAEAVPLRARRVPAHVPVQPVRDHLRRLQRDPEEHHRRAGPRPAARAQGDLPDDRRRHRRRPDPAPVPAPPPGHGLLDRQGGGDHRRGRHRHRLRHRQAVRRGGGHRGHLRRPRAAAGRGRRRAGRPARAGRRPAPGRALRRHRRGPGAAPLRRRRRAPRPDRRGRQQRRAGRAGRRRRHDRRPVGAGPRRHPDRHLPVHPGRPPPLLRPGRGRGHRQQRLGARAGGPRPASPTTPRPRPGSWP